MYRVVTQTSIAAFKAVDSQQRPILGIEIEFISLPSDRTPNTTTTAYRMTAADGERLRAHLVEVLSILDRTAPSSDTKQ